MEYNSGQTAAL